MVEQHNCSFDELVSTHTYGQLTLLSAGAFQIAKLRQAEMEKARKEGERESKRLAKGRKPRSGKKLERPAFTSGEQYMAWMDQRGKGLI